MIAMKTHSSVISTVQMVMWPLWPIFSIVVNIDRINVIFETTCSIFPMYFFVQMPYYCFIDCMQSILYGMILFVGEILAAPFPPVSKFCSRLLN